MIAVFSGGDATVIAALVTAIGVAMLGWRQGRANNKQMVPIAKELQPNAGTSLRDAVDRTERQIEVLLAKIDDQIIPRFDGFAIVQANHANRLAANEAAIVVNNIAVANLQPKGNPHVDL
jgi:hypothetical protein